MTEKISMVITKSKVKNGWIGFTNTQKNGVFELQVKLNTFGKVSISYFSHSSISLVLETDQFLQLKYELKVFSEKYELCIVSRELNSFI